MSIETLKAVFIEAGIEPASSVVPRSNLATRVEAIELHEMSLRHYRIALDHGSRPTEDISLWYDGHFGMPGGPSSMLLDEDTLLKFKQQLSRFSHEDIAAFNIAQIETGLAAIAYLKERAIVQESMVIGVTLVPLKEAPSVMVLPANPSIIERSDPSRQIEHHLAL